jgi:hypothetical protein
VIIQAYPFFLYYDFIQIGLILLLLLDQVSAFSEILRGTSRHNSYRLSHGNREEIPRGNGHFQAKKSTTII